MGRKALPKDDRRSRMVRVMVTSAEARAMAEAAGDKSVSSWLRALALKAMRRRR